MIRLVLYTIFLIAFVDANAQVKAWVVFKDKPKVEFDAQNYFTAKNFQRKSQQSLPDYDNFDLPVNQNYIDELNSYCDSITYVSRWLNAACVYTNEDRLSQLQELSFVSEIEIVQRELILCSYKEHMMDLHQGELNLLQAQTSRMNTSFFKQQGIKGKGITIAIIDAGFKGYMNNLMFEDLRANKQIKHTWDFIKKSKNVDLGSSHGTAVLSCIAGKLDTIYAGCAPDADFLLYRTEKAFNEKLNEEEYWMAAMEEADRQGADIINTSLGYTNRRYFENDMDGKKSMLARAANIASRKGMLVVCSAGNEGDIDWKTICTPADADSVLTVGAINPWTGIQASWSSYGPTADKRLKPNVSAYGYVMGAERDRGIEMTLGTSFSSPLVAGFAACTRQLFPDISSYQLLKKIESSADLYPYYDYAHGHGVPQAQHVYRSSIESDTLFDIQIHNDSLIVMIRQSCFQPSYLQTRDYYYPLEDSTQHRTVYEERYYSKSYHVNDGFFSETNSTFVFTTEPGYFYYKTSLPGKDRIEEYAVTNVRKQKVFAVKRTAERKNYIFHYKGFTQSIEF